MVMIMQLSMQCTVQLSAVQPLFSSEHAYMHCIAWGLRGNVCPARARRATFAPRAQCA